MSTTETNGNTSSHAASTETTGQVGQQTSGRFRPLSAMPLIRRKLRGNIAAMLVAKTLAQMTRAERGQVEVTLSDLARELGISTVTLGRAITKIEEAGLLTKVRRGSVANVYRWTEAAYTNAYVGGKPEKWYTNDESTQGASVDAAEATDAQVALEAVRRHHGAARAERYGIPAAASSCSRAASAAIGERFAHLARQAQRDDEPFDAAADRVARRGVAVWLGRKGHNDFLLRNRHPLERMADPGDLDWVTGELGVHRPPVRQQEPVKLGLLPGRVTPTEAEAVRRAAMPDGAEQVQLRVPRHVTRRAA